MKSFASSGSRIGSRLGLKTNRDRSVSINPPNPPEISIKEGQLYVIDRSIWQFKRKRWAILDTTCLKLYRSRGGKEDEVHYLREFSLAEKDNRSVKNHTIFKITNEVKACTYYFASDTPSEANNWINTLNGVIKVNRRSSDNLPLTLMNWEIEFKEIVIDAEEPIIGLGACASVIKGIWRETEVAVKYLHPTGSELTDMLREVASLCRLRHPNIVQFMGACRPPNVAIITQFIKRGSLSDILHSPRNPYYVPYPLPWKLILNIASDVCKAMAYLHAFTLDGKEQPILHRDLKPENLLVVSLDLDSEVNIKVADFGMSKILLNSSIMNTSKVGTPRYMAPEVITLDQNENYATKIDVHSYSMCIYETITRKLPYEELEFDFQVMESIIRGYRPILPDKLPTEVHELLVACWQPDPKHRYSFAEILPRLKSIDEVSSKFLPIHEILSQTIEDVIFGEQDSITIDKFSHGLKFVLRVNDSDAEVLAENLKLKYEEIDVIRKSALNHLCKWFSPLLPEDPRQTTLRSSSSFITSLDSGIRISQIASLLKSSWFHGFVDHEDVLDRLKEQGPGCYLICFDHENAGSYTLSYVRENRQIVSLRIELGFVDGKSRKGYLLEGDQRNYPSFSHLIHAHSSLLKYPCPKLNLL
eukprot:TRINITY_DN8549_c0_g1_i1.p1 TRINITY_DN8549_c0_g1~~TRINITY_DN8549_c0_g1_i1.p1  ORF type:complete len:644 (-),score=80.64 TRINITY_DN8549_c0_g1_i1:39-1970(-)